MLVKSAMPTKSAIVLKISTVFGKTLKTSVLLDKQSVQNASPMDSIVGKGNSKALSTTLARTNNKKLLLRTLSATLPAQTTKFVLMESAIIKDSPAEWTKSK